MNKIKLTETEFKAFSDELASLPADVTNKTNWRFKKKRSTEAYNQYLYDELYQHQQKVLAHAYYLYLKYSLNFLYKYFTKVKPFKELSDVEEMKVQEGFYKN